MAWARLEDRFHDNRKVKRAWRHDRSAVGLHVMAITYCAGHETDGLVDEEFVEEKAPVKRERERMIGVLVECGLWAVVDGGWQINDYLDYNPSRAELDAKRAKDAERKARGRQTQSEQRRDGVQPESARIPSGGGAESSGPVPTRPDPTQESSRCSDTVREAAKSKTADPGALPADFPDDLVDVADHALNRLVAVYDERGGNMPTLRGVGLALKRFPDRDHRAVLAELEHWALAGRGARRTVKDWPKTFATFLDGAPAGRPSHLRSVVAGPGMTQNWKNLGVEDVPA